MGLRFWIKLHIRLNLSTNTVSAVQMSRPHQKSDYLMSKANTVPALRPTWSETVWTVGFREFSAERRLLGEKTESHEAQVDRVIQHKP